MKKAVAILLCLALTVAMFAVSASALTEEEANAGYYLVGSMTDWQIVSDDRLYLNPADQNEYVLSGFRLTTSDTFKVVYSHDGHTIDEYFPTGLSNDCSLAVQKIYNGGLVDIYFRPDMNGSDGWYYGCIYMELKAEKPTDAPKPSEDERTGGGDTIDGGYYVVFKGDDYRIRQRNRMDDEFGRFALHNITMSTATPFKIAYSLDLDTVTALYPEGEGNDYIPHYNSRYFTVEFTPDGSNGGDSSDMGWYDGYVRAYPCEPPQEGSTEVVPVTNKEMKVNLYEDAFTAAYPHAKYACNYEELYYHRNQYNSNDWVLVRTPFTEELDGGGYGVFDEIAVFSADDYPFTLGFGVYDIRENAFYSIAQAWDMEFEDLHDVFVHIAPQYAYSLVLGDADGDHELTVIDVTLIQRCLAGMKSLDNDEWVFYGTTHEFGPKMKYLTDFDCDGERTVLDVTLIQRHLVGVTRYPHDFTASVKLEKEGDSVNAAASSSFVSGQVQYCYTIEGTVYAASVYGNDFGSFEVSDDNPEPGNFQISTGWVTDDQVELPLTSLTYNDTMTLKVQVRGARGNEAQPVKLYFRNVY